MSKYKVHSCHVTRVEVPAKAEDGTAVVGLRPVAVIELISLTGAPTVTKHIDCKDEAEAEALKAKYAVDKIVTVELGA